MTPRPGALPSYSDLAALTAAVAVLGAALVLIWPAATAAQGDRSSEAAAYLEKMKRAERATYQARELVVYFGPPQSAAVIDVSSSAEGQFLRAEAGSVVTKLWKRSGMGVVSSGADSITDREPASVPVRPSSVMTKYEITVERPQNIFGVKVVPLTLVRRSDRATVERLWLHDSSGIVYRRELYGPGGKLIGMSAVVDMRWGQKASVVPFEPGATAPSRAWTMRASEAPDALSNGYALVESSRMQLRGKSVEHWLYTDGLHALSVFRCAGHLRAPAGFAPADLGTSRGWVGPGPGTWAWEGDGASWVLVAEETRLDPGSLTDVFPRGGASVWARMGSVWSQAFRAVGGLFD